MFESCMLALCNPSSKYIYIRTSLYQIPEPAHLTEIFCGLSQPTYMIAGISVKSLTCTR